MPGNTTVNGDRWPPLELRAAAFDRLDAGAAVIDSDGVVATTNQAWRLFSHLNDGSAVGTGVGTNYLDICDQAAVAGEEASAEIAAGLREILSGDRYRLDVEYPCPSPAEERWYRLQASALWLGDAPGAVVFHLDVTARKHLTDRLVVGADQDALTGLPNRRAASGYLDKALALARTSGATVSLLFIDINEFQAVNETMGRQVSDQLLVKVGLRIAGALRDDDIQFRVGDDEFVVICHGADREGFLVLADRLRAVMSSPFQIGAIELFGHIAVGVADSNKTSTAESMFLAGEEAMHADRIRGPRSPLPVPLFSAQTNRRPALSRPSASPRLEPDSEEGRAKQTARAAAALRTSNELVIFFAADGTIEWVSPACVRLVGIQPHELVGVNGVDLIHPDDQARAVAAFISIPNTGDQVTADFRVFDAQGRIRWVEETVTNLLDDPTVGSVVGNLRDVTERVELLERVELDRRRLAAAQAAARLGSFELDLKTGELTRSDEMCRILGVPTGSNANLSELNLVHPDDRHKLNAILSEATASDGGRGEVEYRIVRPDGAVRWVQTQAAKLPGPNTSLIAGTMLDITDRHAADEALEFQATHDWLTGLPNPSSLHASLRQMLASATQGSPVMVAALGIDNFRHLNTVRGSLSGDEALRSVAQRLKAWAEPGDIIGRVRGDEFVVARSADVADPDPAAFGQRLKNMLAEPTPLGDGTGAEPRLSFSVGITTSTDSDSAESMLADGDAAMDDAKRDGGDRVVVFDDDARARATRRRSIASCLALALERDELRIEYQPILDLASLRTIGFEALLRWTHPDLGPISPAEFIPIAESDRLIGPIGTWVIDQATQQLAAWLRDPRVPNELWISVNVSAQQLSIGGLADRVGEAIRRNGVPAAALHLEITESVLMDRIENALPTIADLHSRGVNLTIDDFGTGYSSLSYLSRLPVQSLKIDRSFVNALSATGGTSIVHAMITLGHSLALDIVAEGVETSQQLEALRALGCTNGQGFLWSRALGADDALRWIVDSAPLTAHAHRVR